MSSKSKTVSMKRKEKRGEGVWLGASKPDTRETRRPEGC